MVREARLAWEGGVHEEADLGELELAHDARGSEHQVVVVHPDHLVARVHLHHLRRARAGRGGRGAVRGGHRLFGQ